MLDPPTNKYYQIVSLALNQPRIITVRYVDTRCLQMFSSHHQIAQLPKIPGLQDTIQKLETQALLSPSKVTEDKACCETNPLPAYIMQS